MLHELPCKTLIFAVKNCHAYLYFVLYIQALTLFCTYVLIHFIAKIVSDIAIQIDIAYKQNPEQTTEDIYALRTHNWRQDIQCGAVITVKFLTNFHKKDTPYITRSGEIWAVFYGSSIWLIFCLSFSAYINVISYNIEPRYNDTRLYMPFEKYIFSSVP